MQTLQKRPLNRPKQQLPPSPTQMTTINLTQKTDYQVLVSILYAHVMNLANPGTFNREMNELLKMNNLPPMNFPANPDSSAALKIGSCVPAGTDVATRLHHNDDDSNTSTQETTTTEQAQQHEENQHPDEHNETDDTVVSEDVDILSQNDEPEGNTSATELGLKLYFGKRQPRKFDEHLLIAHEIEAGTVKFTYTDADYSSHQITQLIRTERIEVHRELFTRMDPKVFAQLSNGLALPSTSETQHPAIRPRARQQR